MDFIMEDGYQVKWGMHAEYQQWVTANTGRAAAGVA